MTFKTLISTSLIAATALTGTASIATAQDNRGIGDSTYIIKGHDSRRDGFILEITGKKATFTGSYSAKSCSGGWKKIAFYTRPKNVSVASNGTFSASGRTSSKIYLDSFRTKSITMRYNYRFSGTIAPDGNSAKGNLRISKISFNGGKNTCKAKVATWKGF